MTTTVKMQAPAAVPNGSIVRFRDTTSGTVDASGRIDVPLNDIVDLLNGGFTFATNSAPNWQTGRFFVPPNEVMAAFLTIASVLYAVPIFIPSRTRVKSLSVNVTTGNAGDVGHLGLYNDVGGLPDGGSLIVDTGELVMTATAVATGAVDVTVNPGLYWLASAFDAGGGTMPSVAAIAVSAAGKTGGFLGNSSAANALAAATTNNSTGRKKTSFTYGALPATFPTSVVQAAASTPTVAIGT